MNIHQNDHTVCTLIAVIFFFVGYIQYISEIPSYRLNLLCSLHTFIVIHILPVS